MPISPEFGCVLEAFFHSACVNDSQKNRGFPTDYSEQLSLLSRIVDKLENISVEDGTVEQSKGPAYDIKKIIDSIRNRQELDTETGKFVVKYLEKLVLAVDPKYYNGANKAARELEMVTTGKIIF